MGAKLPEEKSRPPVQHCHVHAGHCMAEQRHARSFVHTAGLGAQNSVLQGLAQANAVTTGDGVRLLDSLQWSHCFSVDLGAPSLLKLQGDLLLLVWSILGPDAHDRVHDGDGSLHGLQVLCLVAQPADIRIRGVALRGLRDDLVVDAMLLQECQHLRAPWELLQQHGISPGGVDFEGRIDDIHVSLEAHLVVATARRPVGEDGAAMFLHLC
mmetsp:Transcript_125757/g.298525  ORF Transcript_125757/g.298525 Transcript_125757/m.298525 type:complete len:211 (+) Transcript_125757:485-1117(+)